MTQNTLGSSALTAVVRKATTRLIPILLLMYILAFLDRANVGFAKAGLQADAGISDAAFALGAGIFFLGYAIFEVPSNLLMRKFGARAWLARIMISWGIVSGAMMFIQDEWSFYALRVLLGITEAGFFPGVILYLTTWIPVQYRARVNGYFYFGAPLAFILGGPLSGLLLDLDGLGGLAGWKILFLVTGILTIVVGLVSIAFLPNGPKDAKWLTEPERATLLTALEKEDTEKQDHSPRGAFRALANPRVLYFALAYFTVQSSVYGVTFFLPTQIATIVGEPVGLVVGLVTAIPWGFAIIAVVVLTRLADRTGRRRYVAAGALGAAALGIVLSVVFTNPILALAALSVGAAGFIAVQPVFWTISTSFLVGAAAASGIALINSIGNLGGFLAPNIKTWADATIGAGGGSVALAIIAALGAVLILFAHKVAPAVSTAERAEVEANAAVAAELAERGAPTPR